MMETVIWDRLYNISLCRTCQWGEKNKLIYIYSNTFVLHSNATASLLAFSLQSLFYIIYKNKKLHPQFG